MEPKYIPAESTTKPLSIEMCKNTVYLRTDFKEQTRTDDQENQTVFWTYREARLTPEAFNVYVNLVTTRNAINGVNDSGNISQLMIGQENGDNNQLILMDAIADLYDVIANMM